jgi:hypothetical protein
MLIINESSIGAFLLTTLYLIYLVISLCISFISCTCWVPTISALNLAIFPLPHKPAAQKLKKNCSTLIWCSRIAIAPVRMHVELWSLSAAMLPRVFGVVFCKTLFGNILYIVTLVVLYPFSVRYVCKLDSWAHILWVLDFDIKTRYDRVVSEPCQP